MLTHLHISNYALVKKLSLDIEKGMSVLTGETGAGKSILLGALSLALGDRAKSDCVRHGASKAEVSLHFDVLQLPGTQRWLVEHELDAEEDCVLRRIVNSDGRSRAFINGQPVTLQQLRALGTQLIDIHGQHAHHSLLDAANHAGIYDQFAGCRDLQSHVAGLSRKIKQLQANLDTLEKQAADRQQRQEFLQYQINELNTLDLQPGEVTAINEEHKRLAAAESIISETSKVRQLLENDEANISEQLQYCQQLLHPLKHLCSHAANSYELLSQASILVDEANQSIASSLEACAYEPEKLHSLDQRLAQIHDLARKHRLEAAELPQLLQSLQRELTALNNSATTLLELQQQLDTHRQDYQEASARLSQARKAISKTFNDTITHHMQALGLSGGHFAVQFTKQHQQAYSANGAENIHFNVCTNPGQPGKALHKIASGGELSRISLAIEVANQAYHCKPVLIFDEVDVGIGGSTADRVGQYLQKLTQKAQVLCVTHLPQVAAYGQHHLLIRKSSQAGTTHAEVNFLNKKEKIEELARMVGGMNVTNKSRQHAKEMLQARQLQETV